MVHVKFKTAVWPDMRHMNSARYFYDANFYLSWTSIKYRRRIWRILEPWIPHDKLTTYDIKATLLLYCVDLYKCKRVICCTEQKYKGKRKLN